MSNEEYDDVFASVSKPREEGKSPVKPAQEKPQQNQAPKPAEQGHLQAPAQGQQQAMKHGKNRQGREFRGNRGKHGGRRSRRSFRATPTFQSTSLRTSIRGTTPRSCRR